MNYEIRQYQSEDLNDVLASFESASLIAHPFLSDDIIKQELENIANIYIPNTDTWVSTKNGFVVGFVALMGNEIGGLFVKPDFHGTGAGKQLTDKAKELHTELEVEVFKKNSIGRKFYSSYGFKLMSESIHEPTGNEVLRLKFTI